MVGKLRGPPPSGLAITVISAGNKLHDPRGTIPGGPHVVFVVGVVSERVAPVVEVDSVGVAQSGADELPPLAVAVDADDVPFVPGRAAPRLAQWRCAIDNRRAGGLNRVAMDGVNETIRPVA